MNGTFPTTAADCIAELHLIALDASRASGAEYYALEEKARGLLRRAHLAGGAASERQRRMLRDAFEVFNW